MNTQKILMGLLGAQLALATVTWWPSNDAAVALHPLFEVEPDAITHIEILGAPVQGKPATPLVLDRAGESWVVTSSKGYPAKPEKVEEVLSAISDIRVRKPVTTQASSHSALKVGDEGFDKQVRVTAGETTHALTVGAAGSKRAHVRMEGDTNVYEAKGLSAWSLSDSQRSYYDAQYINLDEEALLSLSITNAQGSVHLARSEGSWRLANLPNGELADQSAVDALARKAIKVRMAEPEGTEITPDMALDGGTKVEWTLSSNDQTVSASYRIGAEVDSHRFVKSDDSEFIVRATASSLNALVEANLTELVQDFGGPAEL